MRGQSGTITAVVNALAKAGIELGENGSIFPRPKGKARSQIKGAPTEADVRNDLTGVVLAAACKSSERFPGCSLMI